MSMLEKFRRNMQLFRGKRSPEGSKQYKFVIRTLSGSVTYEQDAEDSTEALELLSKRLGTTPAELLNVTVEVYEDGRKIWEEHYARDYAYGKIWALRPLFELH